MAAAAYALLIAVCTLTRGAPSIRYISFRTPDSSTITTVTATDMAAASATAISTIRREDSPAMVGRVAQVPVSVVMRNNNPQGRSGPPGARPAPAMATILAAGRLASPTLDADEATAAACTRRTGRPGLAAGHCPHDQERLRAGGDPLGQRNVGLFVGQVLLAGEEPHEWPAQHRIAGFERVEDGALGGRAFDREFYLAVDARERPQMRGKRDPDHGSVWTSTDSTAGRSRTIGTQLSPASADTYTCPPVVPK